MFQESPFLFLSIVLRSILQRKYAYQRSTSLHPATAIFIDTLYFRQLLFDARKWNGSRKRSCGRATESRFNMQQSCVQRFKGFRKVRDSDPRYPLCERSVRLRYAPLCFLFYTSIDRSSILYIKRLISINFLKASSFVIVSLS